ncbi:copper amine oxidase N-terminal domain-containing protein [Paenibacillus pasadenensis]|uniref:copper amine oxidase N-terminal domain-containing protein n=1 Tax=Paenibacillus pasadenensis TaxID=217090 RepID=UPI00203E8B23|nr:copper amine oxidase N-terminal domain-containing protein [Paenibacillus pasadenensis]MCM3748221.1 copper amine oxidase N-terminal domain-containing protein [Paenibacillus pasadenensis]
MKKIKMKAIIALCTVMLVVAGCQSVAGLELNSMIVKALKAETQESRGSVTLNIDFAEEAYEGLNDRERRMLELLSEVKIVIDSSKKENASRQSIDGALVLGDREVGFSFRQDEKQAVLQIDGLKRPVVIPLDEESLLGLGGDLVDGAPLDSVLEEAVAPVGEQVATDASTESVGDVAEELIDRVGGYWISNLPNATRLDVKPVTDDVYGGGKAAWQVDAGWQGMELFDWAQSYVKALIADPDGMHEMLNSLFEVFQDHPESGVTGEDGGPLLDSDKEAFVEEGTEAIGELLQETADSMQEAREAGGLEEMFSPASSVNVKLLLDGSLDIRKLDAALLWKPAVADADGEVFPISSVSLRIQSDSWNVNGAVSADRPAPSDKSWTMDRWVSNDAGSSRLLLDFDKSSDAYKLLKNDFQAGLQSAAFYSYGYYDSFISTPSGVTLVPLRTLADSFGATVAYDKARKKWRIDDGAKGRTIYVAKGSKVVYANGVKSQLSFPATVVDDALYVPARDFAKLFGASLKVNQSDYDYDRYLELQREVG